MANSNLPNPQTAKNDELDISIVARNLDAGRREPVQECLQERRRVVRNFEDIIRYKRIIKEMCEKMSARNGIDGAGKMSR